MAIEIYKFTPEVRHAGVTHRKSSFDSAMGLNMAGHNVGLGVGLSAPNPFGNHSAGYKSYDCRRTK